MTVEVVEESTYCTICAPIRAAFKRIL